MAEWVFRLHATLDDNNDIMKMVVEEVTDETALEKVGPKGYIHGWIKVGPSGEAPRKGMGDITVSDHDLAELRKSTAGKYIDEDGHLTPGRQALHDKIVKQLVSTAKPSSDPRFIVMGGGPASGKSSMVRSGKVSLDNVVHVDPDEIKTMLPEVKKMQAEGNEDWAAVSHEESSYLARRVTAAAKESKKNVLLDGTGDSERAKLMDKIQSARKSGYTVEGHYVAVTTATALDRAEKRAQQTGRRVPVGTIRKTYAGISSVLPTVADQFDKLSIYDNNGESLRKIAEGDRSGLKVSDRDAYQAFLDNAKKGAS